MQCYAYQVEIFKTIHYTFRGLLTISKNTYGKDLHLIKFCDVQVPIYSLQLSICALSIAVNYSFCSLHAFSFNDLFMSIILNMSMKYC